MDYFGGVDRYLGQSLGRHPGRYIGRVSVDILYKIHDPILFLESWKPLWVAHPKCSSIGIRFNGADWPIVELHTFRHPTDEQLRHVDIFFSNYYSLQSVHFE